METNKINIAEILRNKGEGINLYSPILGNCKLDRVDNNDMIYLSKGGRLYTLNCFGKLHDIPDSECVLFPSKEMRNWERFSWNMGDVLEDYEDNTAIFDGWAEDDYTSFNTSYSSTRNDDGAEEFYEDRIFNTIDFCKSDEDTKADFIKALEKEYNGKYNPITCEIEKQPEFKEGDIVVAEGKNINKSIFVFHYVARDHNSDESGYKSYIACNHDGAIFNKMYYFFDKVTTFRLATEEEKQKLFAALEKEGKAWDAEKKAIVDLPKKCEFKPFDKVLVRDNNNEIWFPIFFAEYDKNCINDYLYGVISSSCGIVYYKQCIPYNEQTKHLLGTNNEWKGGERHENL